MPLGNSESGAGSGREFMLRHYRLEKQLIVFTDSGREYLAAAVEKLRKRPGRYIDVTVYGAQPPFRGTSMEKYEPPFATRAVVEIQPRIKRLASHQGRLEEAVNDVLGIVQGRCAVWNDHGELYRRGL
ncbi:hypothetical protein HYV83_03805 [Candidatus Woesearchaeota archaeon]|nr:hypothetical protein [Candidatus Woesearchaeota archaeon]